MLNFEAALEYIEDDEELVSNLEEDRSNMLWKIEQLEKINVVGETYLPTLLKNAKRKLQTEPELGLSHNTVLFINRAMNKYYGKRLFR
jgi:hypothetical protein